MPRPIRILTFSTLYPSGVRPSHGIFVETRLRHVVETRQVEARVVAPVPWFPFVHQRFGQYAVVAQTPTQEHRNGLDVWHPRYCLLPKIGMTIAPFAINVSVNAEGGALGALGDPLVQSATVLTLTGTGFALSIE